MEPAHLGALLRKGRASALLSKQLVRLNERVDLDLDAASLSTALRTRYV